MFIVPASESPMTQGDILSECPLVGLDATEPPSDLRNIPVQRWRARVIVLTQACDLAQAKSGRVLIAQVHDAQGGKRDAARFPPPRQAETLVQPVLHLNISPFHGPSARPDRISI
jgi:hypothetical protein